MAAKTSDLDTSTLKAFENAAAGHDGVMSDQSGELFIKPAKTAEVDFYQQTLLEHPELSELMPTFMGTVSLGAPDVSAIQDLPEVAQAQQEHQAKYGKKIAAETSIVLENMEHGFKRPNVLDIKLGSRLYSDGTDPEKAERLAKVSAETTSGSLHFRIAGMKVWNGNSYDIYDKHYGRKFTAENVKDGFATFFSGLFIGLPNEEAIQLLETLEAEIAKIRHALDRKESRMYSSSILVVYEGDRRRLDTHMGGEQKEPRADEVAPTVRELRQSVQEEQDEDVPPQAFKVKMIDFAHAAWTPGQGKDENVIKGLKNVEDQIDELLAQFD